MTQMPVALATETEVEFFNRIEAELRNNVKRQLTRIEHLGRAYSCKAETMLSENDLIRFGPPIPGVSLHNCFRLTKKGKEFLRS